jgi:hypothetical protein
MLFLIQSGQRHKDDGDNRYRGDGDNSYHFWHASVNANDQYTAGISEYNTRCECHHHHHQPTHPTRFVQAENDYQKFLSTFSLQANALRMRARAVSGERMRCRDAFWRKCGSNDAGESKDQNYDNITQFAEKGLQTMIKRQIA